MNIPSERLNQITLAFLAVLILLALFLLSLTVNNFSNNSLDEYPPTITLSGEGRAFAVPDTAVFSYTVRGEGQTAAEAQEKLSTITSAISEKMEDSGVEEKDIRTQSFNVYPRYEYRTVSQVEPGIGIEGAPEALIYPYPGDKERVLVGYEATQTNEVRVRDTEIAGDLLAMATNEGASNVSSLQFIVWDESAIEAEVRAEAVADAKEKAKALADDLGVRLGKVVGFDDGNGYYPEPYYAKSLDFAEDAFFEESVSADISLGENEMRSYVNITYEIK